MGGLAQAVNGPPAWWFIGRARRSGGRHAAGALAFRLRQLAAVAVAAGRVAADLIWSKVRG